MHVNGIVLAGGIASDKLRTQTNVSNEALIPICDRPMVDYVVKALKNSGCVGQVALVGPVLELQGVYGQNTVVVPAGETIIQSLVNGLRVVEDCDYVLITSADIPLVSPAALVDFIESCCRRGSADFYYPIVEKSLSESRYPGAQRTYVDFVEGSYTGGNIFLVRPEIIYPRIQLAERLIGLRKSPLKLCRVIGLRFIVKYLLHRLTLQEAEERFSDLLGMKGAAVICCHPEIGMDVDKPSDLELVEQVLLGLP